MGEGVEGRMGEVVIVTVGGERMPAVFGGERKLLGGFVEDGTTGRTGVVCVPVDATEAGASCCAVELETSWARFGVCVAEGCWV